MEQRWFRELTIASTSATIALQIKEGKLPLNGHLQRTAAKHHAEREAAGLLPAITLVEGIDNDITLGSDAIDYGNSAVAGRNSKEFITSGVVAHQIIGPYQGSMIFAKTL
ncbi:hypothetical protein ACLB1M_35025 [Escherichia coli]